MFITGCRALEEIRLRGGQDVGPIVADNAEQGPGYLPVKTLISERPSKAFP